MAESAISNLISQTSNLTRYAIIVAGGSGTRMQAAVPKQFLPLCGKPVLMHTIEAFFHSDAAPAIILVLPAAYHSYWSDLCLHHQFKTPHTLVNGGETRFHSVKNGLNTISESEDAIVAIHDAVRPLVSSRIINTGYEQAVRLGNAVTAIKSRDSVRLMNGDSSTCLNREQVYLVQTPQTFRISQLKHAYTQPYDEKFTDDASVVEETGIKINLAEGSHQNIKITFPEDLAIAEMILSGR